MFRFKWHIFGIQATMSWVTKAYKNEQYNTRLILDPNETFNIIFSDQRNVVNRCSNSTSLFVTFDLRTLCVIIWITRTKYVILLMFHTQWVCLMIKKEQFLGRHFGCRPQDPTLDVWSNFVKKRKEKRKAFYLLTIWKSQMLH